LAERIQAMNSNGGIFLVVVVVQGMCGSEPMIVSMAIEAVFPNPVEKD
jgi:hypothetical protein